MIKKINIPAFICKKIMAMLFKMNQNKLLICHQKHNFKNRIKFNSGTPNGGLWGSETPINPAVNKEKN